MINKNRGFFPQLRFFYLNKKKHYAFKRYQRSLQAKLKKKTKSKFIFKKHKQNKTLSQKPWTNFKTFTNSKYKFKPFVKNSKVKNV